MKKAGYALIILTLMLCIFACGFLIGRNFNRSDITVVDSTVVSTNAANTATASRKININTASVEELTLLPGLGQKTAQKIIAYREQIGGFSNLEQLMEIEGIGEKKYNAWKIYLTIS